MRRSSCSARTSRCTLTAARRAGRSSSRAKRSARSPAASSGSGSSRTARWLVIGAFFAVTAAQSALLAVRASLPLLAVAAAGAGFAFSFGSLVWETCFQQRIARDKLSRVSAYNWLGAMAFLPAGYAIAGPVASVIGISTSLWIGAARDRRHDRGGADGARRRRLPHAHGDTGCRTGVTPGVTRHDNFSHVQCLAPDSVVLATAKPDGWGRVSRAVEQSLRFRHS
jgi:hypothetical protein